MFKMIFKVIDKVVCLTTRYISALGISLGVAIAFGNVVNRYIFDGSFTWAAELTIYLFLWSTFFGMAYCFKHDAHISINILLEKVNPKIAKILLLISHTITFIFLAVVGYFGYKYLLLVIDLEEISVDLEIDMWIPYLVIPISFAIATFRVGEKIVEIIQTPADKVLQKSEAEMILEEMSEGENEKLLKEVARKTGGML